MSCCGQSRARLSRPRPPRRVARPRTTWTHFEYIGPTALTVRGPVSGLLYRFPRPTARVAVDSRDRASLAMVPQLRQLPGGRRG